MLFFLYFFSSYFMGLNWFKSQEVPPVCVFCLQFAVWTVCVYLKYYMVSIFIKMFS